MVKWHIFLLALFIGSRFVAQDATTSASTCITPPAENVQLDTTAGYADAIQSYLSAGGDPAQLKSLLQPLGVMPDPQMSDGIYVTDLTGDSIDDVIVNIAFPAERPDENTFVVWIYLCDTGNYRRAYETSYRQVSTLLDPGMYVDSIQDLNHDSRPEVVHHFTYCGQFCYMDLLIEGWNRTTQQIHQMLHTSFQIGDYQFIDPDGDGVFDVIVLDENGGPAGAGPLRRWQIIYGWDGVNFTQHRSVPEAPRFGFEAAQDAAAALNAGDLQTAAILYQKILDNHILGDLDERTDAITKTQALFGLLVIRMAQGDQETGAVIYTELQNAPGIPEANTYPKKFYESVWTQVGRTFYSLALKHDLSKACDAVIVELNTALANERQSPYIDYWGDPRPEHICPF